MNGGICDGLTYEEIAAKYPQEFALRDQDKYRYRYPKGESYEDVCQRLQSVVADLRQRDRLLVICHQAVARCIFASLYKKSPEELPYIEVPLHTIFRVTFNHNGEVSEVKENPIPIEHIDTQRWKPHVSENFFSQRFS